MESSTRRAGRALISQDIHFRSLQLFGVTSNPPRVCGNGILKTSSYLLEGVDYARWPQLLTRGTCGQWEEEKLSENY